MASETRICPKCENVIPAYNDKCIYCGNDFQVVEKKSKRTHIIMGSIIVVLLGIIVFLCVNKSESKNNKAVTVDELLVSVSEDTLSANETKNSEAISEEKSLEGSKAPTEETESTTDIKVKDIIEFGNTEWIELDVQEDKALLLSKEVIGERAYNDEFEDITWEKCSLRAWLNDEYINSAFSENERAAIQETHVVNDDNPVYTTIGGNDTTDKIFLLSIDEVEQYFATDEDRIVLDAEGDKAWWWLRSPGLLSHSAAYVLYGGSVNVGGISVHNDLGVVRPAMWVDIKSFTFKSLKEDENDDEIIHSTGDFTDSPHTVETENTADIKEEGGILADLVGTSQEPGIPLEIKAAREEAERQRAEAEQQREIKRQTD